MTMVGPLKKGEPLAHAASDFQPVVFCDYCGEGTSPCDSKTFKDGGTRGRWLGRGDKLGPFRYFHNSTCIREWLSEKASRSDPT